MPSTAVRRLRWTVKQYFRMTELGLLDDRRVELLDGDLIETPRQSHGHRASVSRLCRLLLEAFPHDRSTWIVIRGTLILGRHNAPDPDFHVFDAPAGTPDRELPTPFLAIEISDDDTYDFDTSSKLRVYARAGVEDYWVVNLSERRVEVYRQPENLTGKRTDWRYASVTTRGAGEAVTPLRRPDLTFPVAQMLA